MKIDSLIEKLRLFGLLLHKSWLIRKRHAYSCIFGEILLPIFVLALTTRLNRSYTSAPGQKPIEVPDKYFQMTSANEFIDQLSNYHVIYYAPANDFTKELMDSGRKCFKDHVAIKEYKTESHFMMDYYADGIDDYAAVIFDEPIDRSTKHLSYKIRKINSLENSLYKDKSNPISTTTFYTQIYPIVQIQYCLGRAFVGLKNEQKLSEIPDMYIQRMPYPAHIKQIPLNPLLRQVFTDMLQFVLMFPIFNEIVRAVDEKFKGISNSMAMNGISNTLNLMSWIVSGLLFLGIFLVSVILYLMISSPGNSVPFLYYGNPLLVYFVIIFHLAHSFTFGIHVSAYCSRSTFVTNALMFTVMMQYFVIEALTDTSLYFESYLGILFPKILFHSALNEINNYEFIAEGIQWYNLFVNSNPKRKIGSSIGMFFILSLIGMTLHFLTAIYVLAIFPGTYGAAKHPLFFLEYFRSRSTEDNSYFLESLESDDTNRQFFEPVLAEAYVPGIQIRNLKKDYRISFFNKEKIQALRGVSIDFYKGQITSLLGHNGAGKTTMLSILTNITSATDGIVLINSKDLRKYSFEIMQDMGSCTQEDIYFSSLTVSQQLEFFGRIKRKGKSEAAVQRDVRDLLEKFHLTDKAGSLPDTLSGGQKRRLCLAMAFMSDASIVILDEPTSGLDPESRRVVWDILLKMRGHKTILISTHSMEEADVLGDRIVIMHTGQLKCYGTSLFLKRLIGQDKVEITLSIGPWSDPEKIRSEIHNDGVIVNREPGKLVVSIPNSPALPDSLDNLEKKKKEFGVSGFSVSLISLEQVFIKLTEENDAPPKPQKVDGAGERERWKGIKLHLNIVRALLSKKLTYTLKTYSTSVSKIFSIFVLLLITFVLMALTIVSEKDFIEMIPLNPGIYSGANVLYSSHDKSIGRLYAATSESLGGNIIEVTSTNVERALMKHAKDNCAIYDHYMIAAAEFNKTAFNAFYSDTAIYSLPISANLLWNTIVKKLLGLDYSISVSNHDLPNRKLMYLDTSSIGILIAFFFVVQFWSILASFVIHPRRETSKDVKQLQLMTGVSGFTYWGSMFLFDFLDYMIITALVICGLLMSDSSLNTRLFESDEVWIELLLLVVFGINILPFTYIFTFVDKRASSLVNLFSILTLVYVLLTVIMFIWNIPIFQLVPHVSFFVSQVSYFLIVLTNARCRRLPNYFYDLHCHRETYLPLDVCCGMHCYDGKCAKPQKLFDDYRLNESLTYLCLTPLLYMILLAAFESKLIQKIILMCQDRDGTVESFSDEQVEDEHTTIYQRIQAIRAKSTDDEEIHDDTENLPNDRVYLVYELRKSYGQLRAVRDISFAVNRGECFGLLGVNGAGKSTAFRMMTGRELPDHGEMYMEDKDFKNNRKYLLSQMGYCPQHDAIIKCLNPHEHLKLFARLRGIPEAELENEVAMWIERMNLNAYAGQSSRTLSGGNKRRLNVAMALIGSPNMLFMDEPTTGVDPGARRSLWNFIKSCQMVGQSVVLTSHSMEECEAVCNRLAIMVDGKLVCIGASEELKQRFGAGYDIQIKIDPGKSADQVAGIKNAMSQALDCELTNENLGYLVYHVKPAGTTWRKMYDVMNAMKSNYDSIDEFLVLSSTLEQLFLIFARAANRSSID